MQPFRLMKFQVEEQNIVELDCILKYHIEPMQLVLLLGNYMYLRMNP